MLKKRWLSALLALSLLLVPTTALADGGELEIEGGGSISGKEQATLQAKGGEGETGYRWYRNNEEIKLPEKDPVTEEPLPTDSITTNRSGDYHVEYQGSKSETVQVIRKFETRGSSGILVGRRSNNLAKRKDSQIQKLEARVEQAAADAAEPPAEVSLGMIYSAVEAAASSNGVATLGDAGLLRPEKQSVLMRRLREAGLPDRLYADRVVDRRVVTRLSLVPSLAVSPIDLGLSLGDEALTAELAEAFSNRLLVIDAAQEGSYGQTVEMMVKGDPIAGSSSLSFYRYDADTNRCQPIAVSGVYFDQTGYLHFKISSGGLLIVSEGDLKS